MHKVYISLLAFGLSDHFIKNRFHITTSDILCHSFPSISVLGHCASVTHFAHRQQRQWLCCLLVSQWWTNGTFDNSGQSKGGISQKWWKCSKEQKSGYTGIQIQFKCEWSYRRNSGPWNVNIVPMGCNLHMSLEERCEGRFSTYEHSGDDQKDDDVPEVVLANPFTLTELLAILHIDKEQRIKW